LRESGHTKAERARVGANARARARARARVPAHADARALRCLLERAHARTRKSPRTCTR